MSSMTHPSVAARRHWSLAAAYAAIAALPQLLLLGTQVGVVPQAYAVFFGSSAMLPPILLGGAEVNPLVWAWAIFFGVLALMTASERKAGVRTRTEPTDGDGPPGETEMPTTQPLYGRGSEPPADDSDNLPAVDAEAAGAAYGDGSRLYGLGSYEEAIRSFERAIELNPRSAAAWHSKGKSLCAIRRYEEGVRSFNEALMLDRQNGKLWHDKGNALAKLDRQGEAIRCFKKAHEVDPSYPSPVQP
jgi:tetratricopeptide (TPR) repeat protein